MAGNCVLSECGSLGPGYVGGREREYLHDFGRFLGTLSLFSLYGTKDMGFLFSYARGNAICYEFVVLK